NHKLPPGSLGWPLIGETLEFVREAREEPMRFIRERMKKHDSRVFKTSILGEPVLVFCGADGNKLLFTNENKLVKIWWPTTLRKLLGSSVINAVGDEAQLMRRLLLTFLRSDALKCYVERMDMVTQEHITAYWEGKEDVRVYPTIKLYTFELACRLFMSMNDPMYVSRLLALFNVITEGVLAFPINIPLTRFNRSMRAASAIRKELQLIIRQRRIALESKLVSSTQDLMSHLLVTPDANGKFLTDLEIIDNILVLLLAGHDTSSSTSTMLMKYLAELPEVYEKVFREQIDIAKSKKVGEMLQWEDVQKMRYSWNVASEVMRLSPTVLGSFREAIVDFEYAGYTIPRGWKIFWNGGSTNKDPSLFPNPDNFDASRFEGAGPKSYSYVPFGGGPRMCVGLDFARLQVLVFLHNMVKRFQWDLLIPDERVGYDPILVPRKGLPIRLRP
ncbi:p450 domain-containing protein, partial [Cephalotus follicularis]